MDKDNYKKIFDLSNSIDETIAKLQTNTYRKIVEMFKEVPGIILGDDVGMGKTYIALATAIDFISKYPNKPVIIITPSWILNEKWYNDIRNFIEKNLNKKQVNLDESAVFMVEKGYESFIYKIKDNSKKAKIIIIPINAFATLKSKVEASFFLSCWFRNRGFWAKTRKEILSSLYGYKKIKDPDKFRSIGISYEEIPKDWYEGLDIIYKEKGLSKDGINSMKEEIKRMKYRAMNMVIPRSSLLILDEAHKMKNQETVKRKSLEYSIENKFNKALFLTATPFQLGESELKSVLNIFNMADVSKDEIKKFNIIVSNLFNEMKKYQELMHRFEDLIHYLSPYEAKVFENLIKDRKEEFENIDIKETYKLYNDLFIQKDILENIMKKVLIRNVKKKDIYRNEIIGSIDGKDRLGIPLSDESYLPFALLEKSIYEILSSGERTFIANIKQSFTSSFEAIESSSIYKKNLSSMNILRSIGIDKIKHPKLNSVVDEVVDAIKNDQKTLIFCDRIETLKKLKNNINEKLDLSYKNDIKKLFPHNGQKAFENYTRRFYNKQDNSWFLLQENYIQSILVPVLKLCNKNKRYIPKASQISKEVIQTYRKYNITVKSNYMFLKRIIEQIVFKKVLNRIKKWKFYTNEYPEIQESILNILNSRYIEYGLSLEEEGEEKNYEASTNELRNISDSLITNIIRYEGIWINYHEKLNKLPPSERNDLVVSMIQFLRRDKKFFIKLRYNNERFPEKNDSYLIQKTFKSGNILDWKNSFERFLNKYCSETIANREDMKLGLSSKDIVSTISGSNTDDSRQKIRAGFNTPFYPQILIATSTMQEGIDLQEECKRIIHYDLEWNPASLEQRVGRIDRIGSLVSNLRAENQSITLDVYYPYIKNTIDESIYRTVKDREKWFNILLGGTPQWDTFEINNELTNINPWVFKRLQMDLSVK